MDQPIDNFWRLKLNVVKEKLEENNFSAYIADDIEAAAKLVMDDILPSLPVNSIAWGGTVTFVQTGLYHRLRSDARFEILDTYNKKLTPEELLELRRRSLLTDLFISSVNAITEDGMLVNLDMVGNRVAGIIFGPKHVIILAGRNKIVADLNEAMSRIKNYAAPVNTMRLEKKTPCAKTGVCHECNSPDRICNHWTISEKSFPKGRIKVVLINADLGY